MKNKVLIAISLIALVLLIVVSKYRCLESASSMGSYYVIGNTTYTFSGGRYVKGTPIAKTEDGIILYSLKGDSNRLFIIDSRSNDLYIDENATMLHNTVTGVFINNSYQDNQEIVAFCGLLDQWITQGVDEVVDKSQWNVATATHTSAFLNIELCYDSYMASQTFLGCICKIKDEYYFIASSEIQSAPYTGQERQFQCVAIKEQYYPLINKYYQ